MAVIAAVLWVASVAADPGQDRPAGVPPPPNQRTADCTSPTYASDALVCRDATLLETDRQLVRLYDAAAAAGLQIEGPLTESSTQWFRRRSLCAFAPDHRVCVVAAYRERISVVQALIAVRGGTAPLTVRCGLDEWRGWQVRTAAGLYTKGGRLPAGITFFGRAWSEATLIKLAYAYEQATRHRRAPESAPPLR